MIHYCALTFPPGACSCVVLLSWVFRCARKKENTGEALSRWGRTNCPSIPEPSQTKFPEPCHIKIPEPCHTEIPEPCQTKFPEPCHTKVLEPCHTKIPEPSQTKFPEPCHTNFLGWPWGKLYNATKWLLLWHPGLAHGCPRATQ
uniref:Secreted protein n=1 Tax=Rhinolophus ferrumequinum TaxID=59479 RepID=A0A671F520_RHIFE